MLIRNLFVRLGFIIPIWRRSIDERVFDDCSTADELVRLKKSVQFIYEITQSYAAGLFDMLDVPMPLPFQKQKSLETGTTFRPFVLPVRSWTTSFKLLNSFILATAPFVDAPKNIL